MKKIVVILACMLFCLSLLSGCTDVSPDDNGIVYEFIDPENADGIVVAPKRRVR